MCVGGGAGFSYNTKWGWHMTQHVHLWVSMARRENHSFRGTGTAQFIAVFCTRPPSSDEPRCPTTGGDRSRQALLAMEDYLAVRSDAVLQECYSLAVDRNNLPCPHVCVSCTHNSSNLGKKHCSLTANHAEMC